MKVMSAEKFVKREAKGLLEDNWGIAVFSVLVLLMIPIVTIVIIEMSFSFLGDVETIEEGFQNSPLNGALFIMFNVLGIIAFVLMSPIYNGFVRLFSTIADGKKPDPFDLFYFVSDKQRYKNTLVFMTGVILKSLAILFLFEIIPVGMIVLGSSGDSGVADETAMLVTAGFLAFLAAVIAFLVIHRFSFSVVLYSYLDVPAQTAGAVGSRIAKKNTFRLMKITGSFIPGLLITFFVVPFVYYYPYITCSYMVSTKYLIASYREQNGDFMADSFGAAKQPVQEMPLNFGGEASAVRDSASPIGSYDRSGNSAEAVSGEVSGVVTDIVGEEENSVSETFENVSDNYDWAETASLGEEPEIGSGISFGEDDSYDEQDGSKISSETGSDV